VTRKNNRREVYDSRAELGKAWHYLRELRRHKRLSLRRVQEETGTSGSYLSQVE